MNTVTPVGRMVHKPAVQKIMDLARRFRSASGEFYDEAYKDVEQAAYEALENASKAKTEIAETVRKEGG